MTHVGPRKRYKLLWFLYTRSLTTAEEEHYWPLLEAAYRDMIDVDNAPADPGRWIK